jgi:carotenoid cleavage dioxygenase-like enzyme
MANAAVTPSEPASLFDETDARLWKLLDAETYNANSVYNVPGFKSVHEEVSHGPVTITGALPTDLEGVYIRNGTNPQFDPPSARYHMFGGAAMLHQVQIKDGVATYSNTYVRTPRFQIERGAGREVYSNVADIASAGPLVPEILGHLEKKMATGVIPRLAPLETNQNSTAIQYHHGRLYALNEGGYPFVVGTRLRPDGRLVLDGEGGFETWGGRLRGAFSAHPRIASETGDFYSVNATPSTHSMIVAHVHDGELRECITFDQEAADGRAMGFCHDCFLTENHIVFADVSLRASPAYLMGPAKSMWTFDPGYKLRWGVLPRNFREGDKPRWFTTARAGFIWHMINGWEETRADGGADIVLYAPMYESYPADIPIHTPEEPPAKLQKWVLDLAGGTVTEERCLIEHGYERPSLNVAYGGTKNRYAYLIDEERAGYMGKGVLKYDLLDERDVAYFDYGDYFGGEALFVPRKGATQEDDGYLLELLMADDHACLIVIDARSMTELARLRLPQRVPFGVHACWLDQNKLSGLAVAG